MSLREDVVPEPYISWCRKLQSEAPVVLEADDAREILETELRALEQLQDAYLDLDLDNPIGSAAIGMVYGGVLGYGAPPHPGNESETEAAGGPRDSSASSSATKMTRFHIKASRKGHDHKEKVRESKSSAPIPVAVKVQVPGTEEQFRCDMATVRAFCWVAYPSLCLQLDELERMFLTEFDYVREAANLNHVRDKWRKLVEVSADERVNGGIRTSRGSWVLVGKVFSESVEITRFLVKELWKQFLGPQPRGRRAPDSGVASSAAAGCTTEPTAREGAAPSPPLPRATRAPLSSEQLHARIYVPEAYFATQNVLVMERVPGKNFVKGLDALIQSIADSQQKTVETVEHEFRMRLKLEGYETLEEAKARFFLAGKMLGRVHSSYFYFNPAEYVESLLHFFCHQVLLDGCFQADPHPGNYMIFAAGLRNQDENEPPQRLGCIDFGQLKQLPLHKRISLAKLIVALDEENGAGQQEKSEDEGSRRWGMIANRVAVEELEARSDYMDDALRLEVLRFWISEDHPDLLSGRENLDSLVRKWHDKDPHGTLNADLITANRAAFMIRSLCLELGIRVRLLDFWRPYAEELLRREGVELADWS